MARHLRLALWGHVDQGRAPVNSLRVSGIPEEPDETLETKVIDIFNKRLKFFPPMTENDLDRIHRVGKPDARVCSTTVQIDHVVFFFFSS